MSKMDKKLNQDYNCTPEEARAISRTIPPSAPLKPFNLVYRAYVDALKSFAEFYDNDIYEVRVCRYTDNFGLRQTWPFKGPWARLGIGTLDGTPRHDWREFQQIKNLLLGPEWEAVELYPAESRLIDPSNYFILWCSPHPLPLGMHGARTIAGVDDCIAPQRGWETP